MPRRHLILLHLYSSFKIIFAGNYLESLIRVCIILQSSTCPDQLYCKGDGTDEQGYLREHSS
jgi:hypothetical protein